MISQPELKSTGDSVVSGLFYTLRPWQWYKQLILFVAIIFSGSAGELDAWLRVITGAGVFSLVAGTTYVLNDVSDISEDRNHPRKQHRPIPSGQLPVSLAVGFVVFAYVVAGVLAWKLQPAFFALIGLYVCQNVAYSYVLKEIIFVDLFSISAGFVIRAIAGVVLVGSPLSPWLLLCSFLAALLLAITKRWGEYTETDTDAKRRSTLDVYTPQLLQFMFTNVVATLLVAYSMYTFFAREIWMMLTIPFAFYAVFRFAHLAFLQDGASEPQKLLLDRPLLADVCAWGITAVLVLYQPDPVADLLMGWSL